MSYTPEQLRELAAAAAEVDTDTLGDALDYAAARIEELERENVKQDAQAWRFLVETADAAREVVFQNFDGLQVMIYRDHYHREDDQHSSYGFDEHSWAVALLEARAALEGKENKELHHLLDSNPTAQRVVAGESMIAILRQRENEARPIVEHLARIDTCPVAELAKAWLAENKAMGGVK